MLIFVIPVIVFASLTFAGGIASNTDQPPKPNQVQAPAPAAQAAPSDAPKR
jgi:hypothetical protein